MRDVHRSVCDTWLVMYVVSRIRRDAFAHGRCVCGFKRMKFESCALLLRQHRHHSHTDQHHDHRQKQKMKCLTGRQARTEIAQHS